MEWAIIYTPSTSSWRPKTPLMVASEDDVNLCSYLNNNSEF